MNSFDKLIELLEEKKKQDLNEEEIKKVEFLSKLFKDRGCFFKLKAPTAFGILEFLGVDEKDIQGMYFDLISAESFKENTPKIRHISI